MHVLYLEYVLKCTSKQLYVVAASEARNHWKYFQVI